MDWDREGRRERLTPSEMGCLPNAYGPGTGSAGGEVLGPHSTPQRMASDPPFRLQACPPAPHQDHRVFP